MPPILPTYLLPDEEAWIELLLTSNNPQLEKRGLQRLCQELQRGRLVLRRARLIGVLRELRFSDDIKVRSWLYNTIARMRAREFIDYLVYQLPFRRETDEENRTWAAAAYFSVASEDEIEQLVTDPLAGFGGSAAELSSQLYYNGKYKTGLSAHTIMSRIEANDLFAMWFALLFGYERLEIRDIRLDYKPSEVLAALNCHHVPEVTEYSLWALYMAKHSRLRDTTLDPGTVNKMTPNVRRWYYRLAGKASADFRLSADYLLERVRTEREETAREGLALGLQPNFRRASAVEMLEWATRERSALVRLALLPHFVRFSDREPRYAEFVSETIKRAGSDLFSRQVLLASIATLDKRNPLRGLVARDPDQPAQPGPIVSVHIQEVNMAKEEKNVLVNVAREAGRISVGAVGQGVSGGEVRGRAVDSALTLDNEAFRAALKGAFAALIDLGDKTDGTTKANAAAALNDILIEAEGGRVPQKSVVERGLSVLRGIANATPSAAEFVKAVGQLTQFLKSFL